jgi:hypothetical protein
MVEVTPFGHIGGGLIVGCLVEKIMLKGEISLAALGIITLFSILPDLDSIPAYLFKGWKPGQKKLDHHGYFTHTPFFYILLGTAIWLGLGKDIGILFLSITLTHLLLDSWATDDGIMWLWPISNKRFSILPRNLHEGGLYGVQYYLRYARHLQLSVPEAMLFVGGLGMVIFWWR